MLQKAYWFFLKDMGILLKISSTNQFKRNQNQNSQQSKVKYKDGIINTELREHVWPCLQTSQGIDEE